MCCIRLGMLQRSSHAKLDCLDNETRLFLVPVHKVWYPEAQKKVGEEITDSHPDLGGLTLVDDKLAKNDHIPEEMLRRLVTAFHPDYIYLYGSRARGRRLGRTRLQPDDDDVFLPDPSLPAGSASLPGALRPGGVQGGYCFQVPYPAKCWKRLSSKVIREELRAQGRIPSRQFRALAGEVYQSILARLPQEAHPQSLA